MSSFTFVVVRELLRSRRIGPSRARLLVTALKLGLKYAVLVRLLHRDAKRERLLGLRVEAGRYTEILLLFIEVFLKQDYAFEPTTSSPQIIDCGGNIGLATLYFKFLWPNARVTTIEPSPDSFALLERNLRANGMADVDAHRLAVAGRRGTLDFYVDPGHPTSARSSIRPERGGQQVIQVEAVPLSDLIKGPVDYLKLDIEGAEMEVVQELASSGKLHLIRELAIEYHHHVVTADDRLSQMLAILENEGYGYNLRASSGVPPVKDQFQDVMIYAYRRS